MLSARSQATSTEVRNAVRTHGRVAGPRGAAAKLGIPRQTLEWKIRNLNIDKLAFRRPD